MTSKPSSFGSKCAIDTAFIKKVLKCGVVQVSGPSAEWRFQYPELSHPALLSEMPPLHPPMTRLADESRRSLQNILDWSKMKEQSQLKRQDGAKKARINLPKLDDANDAGGRNGSLCTLILTEGDSAKALAVSGLSVVGRDRYGVFPLRGKLLNVREASHKQVMENAEITAIKKIMGLQTGKTYTDVKQLRYGHIMIMADQDHDGSHIKGLILNFIHSFWPSLLKVRVPPDGAPASPAGSSEISRCLTRAE